MEHLNLKELIRTNLPSINGIHVIYFLSERDIDVQDYTRGQLVIPYSSTIRVVAYNSPKGKILQQSFSLTMPESVFLKIVEDMETMGLPPVKLEMVGRGKDRILIESTQNIIEFDAIRRYLEIGFEFRSCQFSDGRRSLSVERKSRLWSNDLEVLGVIGDNVASYLSKSMENFSNLFHTMDREIRVLKRENIMMFSCSLRAFRLARERIGTRRISYMKNLVDDSTILFIPDRKKNGFLILHHSGETLRMKTILPCSVNLMVEVAEAIEKSGGVFIGR